MSIPNGKNVYGYAEAYAKLANFGQQHLLKYYDELDEAQRAALLNQIEQIDFSVVSTNKQPEKRGRITPIGVTELAEIRTRGDEFFDAGMAELRAGHVGAVLLAGGMGTRLGSDAPKGAFNIGIKRELYIFECLINNLLNVTERVGSFVCQMPQIGINIPCFQMVKAFLRIIEKSNDVPVPYNSIVFVELAYTAWRKKRMTRSSGRRSD